uniref:Fatty-acid and retinol-binding protein 1 n=1 Tax=Parastrongyloides trichosuri TaxID=131310 RepID=A0A0N4ZW25_PARTI
MNIYFLLLIVIFILKLEGNVISYDHVSNDEKKYIPTDIRTFYDQLNNEERFILYNIVKTHRGNDNEAIKKIKEQSPSLSIKVKDFYSNFNNKVNSLSKEARMFFNLIKQKAGLLMSYDGDSLNLEKIEQFMVYFVGKYNQLTERTKNELNQNFPSFQFIADKHSRQEAIEMFS